ncbi:hypothetical protein BG015_000702 [Linnemannia schmuckeri]|uniref:FAD-binding FR-type domain-containing protein n=1 Tax=Linnemannia schmuckeri TaxID=64567 RepID=A0A9P5RR77_9FUNG|nr:hypothetical protein BG015_000702 [Linnemannia schmuckeri]
MSIELLDSQVSLYDRWHSGERKLQDLLQVRENVKNHSSIFRPYLTTQMQDFVPGLNYFFIGTLDEQGRPWVSFLTGRKGFMNSPHIRLLEIKTRLEGGVERHHKAAAAVQGSTPPDPLFHNLTKGETLSGGRRKWGGVALDFTNRRRNKMNGVLQPNDILKVDEATGELHVLLTVEQTIGNCPKYITIREMDSLEPQDTLKPKAEASTSQTLDENSRRPLFKGLTSEQTAIVDQADCLFIASRFIDESIADQTSGMDCNHRGGNPGFARVSGNQIVFPDYSGNRFFNTLGNIMNDERVGLLFVNFGAGDTLQVTGRARILIGKDAQEAYPHAQRVVQVTIEDSILRPGSLPFRMRTKELSPYNPVTPSHQQRGINKTAVPVAATLSEITVHTDDIRTFRFKTSKPIRYSPGQYAVLDFGAFNALGYRHMAPDNPQSLNDDYIRTWTISSAPLGLSSSAKEAKRSSPDAWNEASEFALTIKRKPGGTISNLLHNLSLDPRQPFTIPLICTGGSFVLPDLESSTTISPKPTKVTMISGGIGSTPFISMIRGARQVLTEYPVDIQWILSATFVEDALPEALQELTAPLEGDAGDKHWPTVSVVLFLTGRHTPQEAAAVEAKVASIPGVKVQFGRVDYKKLLATVPDLEERQVLLCGPEPFMDAVKGHLGVLRIPSQQILTEEFNF